MATTGIDHDTTSKAIAKVQEDRSLLALLNNPETQKRLSDIATKALPPEKLLRIVISEVNKNPDLKACSISTVMLATMNLARMGLEPGGVLGHAYLIPFKDKERGMECQLIIGYRGFIELARRSGTIRSIRSHVVRERDEFTCEFGTDPKLVHKPLLVGDAGEVTAAYAVVELKDGSKQVEVMTRAELDKTRASSKSGGNKYGPWVQWESEMQRKTVVRRICKYLPLSAEEHAPLREALRVDNDDFNTPALMPHQPGKLPPATLRGVLGIEAPVEVPAKPVADLEVLPGFDGPEAA